MPDKTFNQRAPDPWSKVRVLKTRKGERKLTGMLTDELAKSIFTLPDSHNPKASLIDTTRLSLGKVRTKLPSKFK